jgi:hypothetical protein
MAVPAIVATALHTRRRHGVPLLRQARDIMRLRWGRSHLDAWEYYFFEVFADRYPMDEKRRFIGWRRERDLDRALNRGPQRELANDKLRFSGFMRSHGIPVPRVVAAFAPGVTDAGDLRLLTDADALARFLAESREYPLFAKPVRGAHGRDACVLRHRPDDGGISELAVRASPGWLFQELLVTHHAVANLCGDRLTSVRAVVLSEDGAPRILSAVWRMPAGANVTDNFGLGFNGNLIAAVDLATGEISNVMQGAGWDTLAVAAHPDTGVECAGFRLPDWDAARALCLDAAALLPDLRLQHWDIALTARGPVILEVNVAGGMRTHQIVAGGPGPLRALDKF